MGTGRQNCGGVKRALDGNTDEGQVDDLEQPCWELGAKDDPAVVLVIASNVQHESVDEKGNTHSLKRPRLQVL